MNQERRNFDYKNKNSMKSYRFNNPNYDAQNDTRRLNKSATICDYSNNNAHNSSYDWNSDSNQKVSKNCTNDNDIQTESKKTDGKPHKKIMSVFDKTLLSYKPLNLIRREVKSLYCFYHYSTIDPTVSITIRKPINDFFEFAEMINDEKCYESSNTISRATQTVSEAKSTEIEKSHNEVRDSIIERAQLCNRIMGAIFDFLIAKKPNLRLTDEELGELNSAILKSVENIRSLDTPLIKSPKSTTDKDNQNIIPNAHSDGQKITRLLIADLINREIENSPVQTSNNQDVKSKDIGIDMKRDFNQDLKTLNKEELDEETTNNYVCGFWDISWPDTSYYLMED